MNVAQFVEAPKVDGLILQIVFFLICKDSRVEDF